MSPFDEEDIEELLEEEYEQHIEEEYAFRYADWNGGGPTRIIGDDSPITLIRGIKL